MQSPPGYPIYIESLLGDKEYRECAALYLTYRRGAPPQFFESEFKWRWRMGDTLNGYEIVVINKNLNLLLQKLRDASSKEQKEASPA